MTDDPRKDLETALGALMKSVAHAGTMAHKVEQARAGGEVSFELAKAHRDAEKEAHTATGAAITAYRKATAAGVITLEPLPAPSQTT